MGNLCGSFFRVSGARLAPFSRMLISPACEIELILFDTASVLKKQASGHA